jgi:hypothetical protein
VQPIPCWEARLLLVFSSPYLRLRSPQIDQNLIAERIYDSSIEEYLYAIVFPVSLSDREDADDAIPVFQPNFIRPLVADRFAGWQLGENITLEFCPYPATTQRDWDWDWGWSMTCSPVYLWNEILTQTSIQIL